ncbi:MAG: phage minor head protein [Actinomycetes bacterium]
MSALADAVAGLVEANAALRKRRKLAKRERALERAMAKAFAAEGRAVLAEVARLRSRFPQEVREAISADELVRLYDQALANSLDLFTLPIDQAAAAGLEAGMAAAVADLDVDMSFDLANPRAVDYLRERGLTQVRRIRNTTRETLRRILAQAADEGWSYGRTAKAIRDRYTHFSVERARNIAVYELGDAYEAGNRLVADDLSAGGLVMEKSWLSAGDARVRADHRQNAAAGWIPIGDAFPSGHDRPPTDPRCRCAALYRRKPDA